MNAKQLLLKQTQDAFAGQQTMSLMAALDGVTSAEAEWRQTECSWTIAEIIYHVAMGKLELCAQAFGQRLNRIKLPQNDLNALVAFLYQAQGYLLNCLQACPESALDQPLSLSVYTESPVHLFWHLIMHDLNHAAQIGALRHAYGARQDNSLLATPDLHRFLPNH